MPITVERPSTNPDNLNAMDSRQRNDGDIDLPSDALETMRPSSEKAATLQAENQQKLEDTDTPEYPGGFTLGMITLGLMLMVFCIGLDRSILATAIPKITSEFNSLEDVGWYGSSYLLTTCCFQLMFGKLYAELKTTRVFLAALALFELGSLICAVAPNSITLIVGRAVSGIGCAGLFSGALIILATSVPLHRRPMYTGFIGGFSSIAQIIAPTLGGVFTDRATWRWCFWINLPLGAITAIVMIFVKLPIKRRVNDFTGVYDFLMKLDILGTLIFMPCVVCLLLALEWGGTTYPWSDWRVILCLCIFGVLAIAWGYWQYRQGEKGTLPFRIIKQRSVASGMWFTMGLASSLFIIIYYVPIWFQSVKDTTAEQSGINFVASTAGLAAAAIIGGTLASRTGYYIPQVYFSTIVTSVAAGLIFRYSIDTSTGYWVGTLIMFGIGTGSGLQVPLTAVQTVLKGADISLGTSVIILSQTISGTIFLSVGQNLFHNKLIEELAIKVPQVDPKFVVANGVSGLTAAITRVYGSDLVDSVLEAYNSALQMCFMLCIIMSCLTVFGAVGLEWRNVRQDKEEVKSAAAEA